MSLIKCPYCNQLCTNNEMHICKEDVYLPEEGTAIRDNFEISSQELDDFQQSSSLSSELSHITEFFNSDNTNTDREFNLEAGVPRDKPLLFTSPNNLNDSSTIKLPTFQLTFSKCRNKILSRDIPLKSYSDCFQKTDLNEKHSLVYKQYFSTNNDEISENNFGRTNSCLESMEASNNIQFAELLEKHSDTSKGEQLPTNNSFVLQQPTGNETTDNINGQTDCVSISEGISENPLDSGFKFEAQANSIQNKHFCLDCGNRLGLGYELNECSAMLDNSKSYICELCQKEFVPPSLLKDGIFANTKDDCMAVAGSSGLKTFNRKIPKQNFAEESVLKKQNSLCSVNHDHTSPVSGEQLSTEANLKEHSLKHLEEKTFFCNMCDVSFTHESHLNNHELLHTGKKPFKCAMCAKDYSLKSSFKRHSFIHHDFNCDTCDRSFIDNHSLILHMSTHTGKKLLKCEVCGKEFTKMFSFRRHSLIHSDKK